MCRCDLGEVILLEEGIVKRWRRKGKSVEIILEECVMSPSGFGPSNGHKQKEPTQGDRVN